MHIFDSVRDRPHDKQAVVQIGGQVAHWLQLVGMGNLVPAPLQQACRVRLAQHLQVLGGTELVQLGPLPSLNQNQRLDRNALLRYPIPLRGYGGSIYLIYLFRIVKCVQYLYILFHRVLRG